MGLWKDISKENLQLKMDNLFLLRNGSRICFWEDCWCGKRVLSEAFPILYRLAIQIGVRVGAVIDVWDNGNLFLPGL